MSTAQCAMCGTQLTMANKQLGGDLCRACAKGTSPKAERLEIQASIEATPGLTEESITGRSVMASLPKLLIGAAVIIGCMELANLIVDTIKPRNTSTLQVSVGYVVGVVLVGQTLFRRPHPVDLRRWKRFWRGSIIGSIFAAVAFGVMLGAFSSSVSDDQADLLLALGNYGLYGGLVVAGLINVIRKGAGDIEEVLSAFRQLKRAKASGVSAAEAAGVSVEQERALLDYPLSATAPRLNKATAVAAIAGIVGLVPLFSWLFMAVGCKVSERIWFRDVHITDTLRWERFWRLMMGAHVVTHIALTAVVLGVLKLKGLGYGAAVCVVSVALATGFAHLRLRAEDDALRQKGLAHTVAHGLTQSGGTRE